MEVLGDDRCERWKELEMAGVGGRFSARRSSHHPYEKATNPVARRNERSEAPAKHRNAVPIKPPKSRKNFRKIGDLS